MGTRILRNDGIPPSHYADLIAECIDNAKKDVEAEKDRVTVDKTTEVKDLVAGCRILSIKIGPLVKPSDPVSCVLFTFRRVNPIDAFYTSWLEDDSKSDAENSNPDGDWYSEVMPGAIMPRSI